MKKTSIKKRRPRKSRDAELATDDDLIKARATGGSNQELLSLQLKENFGVPYSFLTEGQWDRIKTLSGLLEHARFEINIALRRYWYARLNQKVSPDTIREIGEARTQVQNVIPLLLELSDNEDLFKGEIVHFDQSAIEQRLEIKRTCERLDRIDTLFANAEARLARGRGGESYGPIYGLIHHLDWILYSELGVTFRRSDLKIPSLAATGSPRELLWAIVKIAHLKITENTLDTVLRDYIKDRGEHDREFNQGLFSVGRKAPRPR